MKKYVLALDQGTTSSRCIIFDMTRGVSVASAAQEFRQIFPREGWVEHDPFDILNTQIGSAKDAIKASGISPDEIAAIGITNQRETTIVWDKNTGMPVYNAIVWQCRRTAELCDQMKKGDVADVIRGKTGLIPDAYFSATKIKWILDNVDGAREKAEAGELMFGTVDTWLIYNITGKTVHATDHTNASRTMLYNINRLEWDNDLLDLFNIPACMMPRVISSRGSYGHTAKEIFGAEIPIAGVAGDQQAALFGQCCFGVGDAKNTYGTGGFMLMNTGATPVFSKNGLLSTIACDRNGDPCYALEGSVFICGAAVQWLRDGMKLIDSAPEIEALALTEKDNGGVYFVPAFVGLGAPYWDPYARGLIIGITRGTTRGHIARAVLESMAYQTYDVLSLMEKESGASISSLYVDGGASTNDLLMSFQADVLNIPIVRPRSVESTAYGAASLAALSVGIIKSACELEALKQTDKVFEPSIDLPLRDEKLSMWHKATARSIEWSK